MQLSPLSGGRGTEETAAPSASSVPGLLRYSVYVIAGVVVCAALYVAEDFLFPLLFALLLTVTLRMPVRSAVRQGIPGPLAAVALGLVLAAGLLLAYTSLTQPIADFLDDFPRIRYELERKLRPVREPVEDVQKATKQIEDLTKTEGADEVQEVVVRQPQFLTLAAGTLVQLLSTVGVTLVLTVFLLMLRSPILSLAAAFAATRSGKLKVLRIWTRVEQEVSSYLLTITIINALLGLCVGLAMWALGMPTPHLWGVMAALFNFLPFVGAAAGIAVVGTVAVVSFDQLDYAMLAPLVYLALTTLEGNFITPTVIGQRLQVTTAAVIVALTFWGFLWGFAGLLVAVPALVVLRSVSEFVPQAAPIRAILTPRRTFRVRFFTGS